MERIEGFYWCKTYSSDWIIAQWNNKLSTWLVPGMDIGVSLSDMDFDEIDENRIIKN